MPAQDGAYNVDDARVVDGMTAQARERSALLSGGARSVGWKAGLGTVAAMDRVGTNAPVAGFLTDATLLMDGRRASIDGWTSPTFEPELALRIDRDLPTGATPDEARAAIGAVAPAIELVDLGPPDDLAAVLATNVFHRFYAIGPWTTCALDDASLRIDVDGDLHAARVRPSTALGDLVEVLRAIATQAELAGASLRAGELVITGSAIPAIALRGGETLAVALEGTSSAASIQV